MVCLTASRGERERSGARFSASPYHSHGIHPLHRPVWPLRTWRSSGRLCPLLPSLSRWIIWACVAARSPVARRVGGADVSPPASTPPRTPLSLYFPLLHTPHWYSLPVYRQLGIPPLQAQERTSRSLCSTADDTHDPVRLGSNKNSHSVTKC